MSKRVKVLHLCAVNAGGAYQVASVLNRELNTYPHIDSNILLLESLGIKNELGLITNLSRKILWLFYFGIEKFQFLFHERDKTIRFAFSHSPFGFKISKNKLFKDADIVHFHWVNKGFLSIDEIGELLEYDKKFIWTLHDFWPLTGGCFHPRGCLNYLHGCGNCHYLKNSSEKDLSFRVYQKKKNIYATKNKIIWCCPSTWMMELMEGNSILNGTRINLIPNPIDIFIDDHNKSEVSRHTEKLRLLFISSNLSNPFKGFENLIKIIEYLSAVSRLNDFDITVIGDFKNKDIEKKKYFTEKYHMKFIGLCSRGKLFQQFQITDLYINLSEEETFGLTNLESLYNGTPVLAFDLPAYENIIIENYSGWVFKKGDISGIGQKVIELCDDRLLLTSYISNCKKIAEKYTARSITKQYLSFYQK